MKLLLCEILYPWDNLSTFFGGIEEIKPLYPNHSKAKKEENKPK